MPITFKDLLALANESGELYPIYATISALAMHDVPMSDAVIRLGIACDILLPGYHNNWSEDMEDGEG